MSRWDPGDNAVRPSWCSPWVVAETVKAAPAGKGAGACGGEPRLGSVWFDVARKRVLVRVDFLTGGDMCQRVPATCRLWAVP